MIRLHNQELYLGYTTTQDADSNGKENKYQGEKPHVCIKYAMLINKLNHQPNNEGQSTTNMIS